MLFAVRARIPVVIIGAATVAATTLIGLAPLSAKPAAATTSAATPTAWVADSFGSGTLRNAVQPVNLLSPAPAQAPINVTTGPFSSVTTDIVGSKVYVTSQFGTTNTTTGALTIIDASSGAVITQVAVGHGPGPVALASDGTRAFVANGTTGTNTTTTTGGSLSDVSLSGLNVTATTTVGGDPVALAVSHGSSGDTVWVANAGSSSVTPVSIGATADTAGTPITIAGGTGEPSAIALSPDQSTLYVVDATHANLWAISTSTRAARLVTSLSMINSGQGPINALTVAPDGTVLPYNSNLGAFVPVVVTPTSAVVGSVISVSSLFGFGGWYPTGQISVTPDDSTVYVTYFNAIVQVLWKSSNPVGSAIPAGNAPTGFALTGSFTGFGERIASQMGCALCSVVAGGTQTSQVTALLSDGSQPLAGHTVALAANHSTAVIAPYGTDVTDSTGAVHFLVYDTVPEVDTFSATDQTTGVTILATTQVTFTQVDTMEQSNSTVSAAPTTLLAGNT